MAISRLKVLQDRSAAIVAEMRGMTEVLATEERAAFNPEETKKYELLAKESADVDAGLAIENQILDREKKLKAVADRNRKSDTEIAELAGDDLVKIPPKIVFKSHGRLKHFRGPNAEEKAWRSGQWLAATCFGSQRALQHCREQGIAIEQLASSTGQSEGTNTAGGYLVPEELSAAIIDLRETYGIFRQNVRTIPMASDSLNMPRRTGGLTAYFVAENNDTTSSTKTWDSVQLNAKEIAALVRYPTVLDEDAIVSIADDLTFEIAYQFALLEDQCGFTGDGTSTYGGIHGVAVRINDGNHAGGIFDAASGHTAFSSLTTSDFNGTVGILPLYARMNAKWYISAVGFANSMERLMYATGGTTKTDLAGESQLSFLGYPVVLSQVLNTTTAADVSAIKCLFGDLRLSSLMGTRREVTMTSSRERYFEFRQIAIQGTERFDINNHSLGAGAGSPGPIVALKTAAS